MRSYCYFFTILTLALLLGCRGSDEAPPMDTKAETYFTLDSTAVGVSTIASGLEVPWEIAWGPDDWIWLARSRRIL